MILETERLYLREMNRSDFGSLCRILQDEDTMYELGDEDAVKIIGVFCRSDGDRKLVAVLKDKGINDFSQLSDREKEDLHRLYPKESRGEGWFGREKAEEIINSFFKTKVKTDHFRETKEALIHPPRKPKTDDSELPYSYFFLLSSK